jgi:hypothetical protein
MLRPASWGNLSPRFFAKVLFSISVREAKAGQTKKEKKSDDSPKIVSAGVRFRTDPYTEGNCIPDSLPCAVHGREMEAEK